MSTSFEILAVKNYRNIKTYGGHLEISFDILYYIKDKVRTVWYKILWDVLMVCIDKELKIIWFKSR